MEYENNSMVSDALFFTSEKLSDNVKRTGGSMLEMFKKTLYATVGLAVMTREKVEEFGEKISREMKMSETEGRTFIDELVKRSEETKVAMDKLISERIEAILKKLDIPSRKEFADLDIRVRKLETAEKK